MTGISNNVLMIYMENWLFHVDDPGISAIL